MVRATDRVGKGSAEHDDVKRSCPMGCKPVPTDRLQGNEMTIEELTALVGDDDTIKGRKRPPGYANRKRGIAVNKYYGFGD